MSLPTMELACHVGPDGVLSLAVPVGETSANTDVLVTIRPLNESAAGHPRLSWAEFVRLSYGSCAGLDLQRPSDH